MPGAPTSSDQPLATVTGGCLCGAVRYECHARLREVVNCHCRMCQKTHGHHAAYTAVPVADLVITVSDGLKWYASSEKADRGFCAVCGASLFWRPTTNDYIAVSAGTLNSTQGLTTVRHVFTAEVGGYYEITDNLEQFSGSMRK